MDQEKAEAQAELEALIGGADPGIEEPPPLGEEMDDDSGFVAGQVYVDAAGNRARYLGNGEWEEL